MDALEAGLLTSLIFAEAARINATATNLIVTIPCPVEWISIERA
jgi:hypothetical protein